MPCNPTAVNGVDAVPACGLHNFATGVAPTTGGRQGRPGLFCFPEDKKALPLDKFSSTEQKKALPMKQFSFPEELFRLPEELFAITEELFSVPEEQFSIREWLFCLREELFGIPEGLFALPTKKEAARGRLPAFGEKE